MSIQYIKADPTGNITALVESFSGNLSPQQAAEKVFSADSSIEQLGFLSESPRGDIALTMAGGEFCGNACLCAAAVHLRRSGLDNAELSVDISGAEDCVAVKISRSGENEYSGNLEMPMPLGIEEIETPLGLLPLVRFPGISHLIVRGGCSPARAEELIAPLCTELGCEALGIMIYNEGKSSLLPLVYVPGALTLCWEHSCASGSSALGAWLAQRRGESTSLRLSQPGGTLGIHANFSDGSLRSLILEGSVSLSPVESLGI